MAVSQNWGGTFLGVPIIRTIVLRGYIKIPLFWETTISLYTPIYPFKETSQAEAPALDLCEGQSEKLVIEKVHPIDKGCMPATRV